MDGQSLPLYHDYSTGGCVLKKKKKQKKLLIPFLLEDLNCQELLSTELEIIYVNCGGNYGCLELV